MKKLSSQVLKRLFLFKRNKLKREYNRVLPLNEILTNRWEKAKFLGFGEGTSIYDSACVFGDVKIGMDTWVGPYTVLDGSGGLTIGNNCSVSAGVHIYSHNTVMWAVSGGKAGYEYRPVRIGDNCFIGPQTIIQNGVTIGKTCILAANSFVNKDCPDYSIMGGNPAVVIGRVVINPDSTIQLLYNNKI